MKFGLACVICLFASVIKSDVLYWIVDANESAYSFASSVPRERPRKACTYSQMLDLTNELAKLCPHGSRHLIFEMVLESGQTTPNDVLQYILESSFLR